jgi:hypothetical protein
VDVAGGIEGPGVWRARRVWMLVGGAAVVVGVPALVVVTSQMRTAVGGLYLVGCLLWLVGGTTVLEADSVSKRFFGRPIKRVRLPADLRVSRRHRKVAIHHLVVSRDRSVISFEQWYWANWDDLVRRVGDANARAAPRSR